MRTTSCCVLVAFAPVLVFGAEEIEAMRAGARNRYEIAAQFRTIIEPNNEGLGAMAWAGGVKVTDDGVFHRYILDRTTKIYVGYDVRIEEGPDKTLLVLTIEPFSLEPSELPIENPGSWKSSLVVREPQRQTVRLLEAVALDLLVREYATKDRVNVQTVVDYISVGRDLERLRRPRQDRSEPRPFKAEDTEMELFTPKIAINGKPFHETKGTLRVTGPTIGLFIKNRGRFLLSMFPHEELGFQRVGWVSRTTLHFEWSGDTYEIESQRRIVPGAGTYHLYVHHDPAYQPWGAAASFDVEVFATGPPASLLESERR